MSADRRIVHVTTGLGLGGAEALLVQCAVVGRARGYEPVVVSLRSGGDNAAALRSAGVRVEELGARPGRPNLRPLRTLTQLLRAIEPAVVQAWMYHANLFGLAAARLAGLAPEQRLLWGIFNTRSGLAGYGATTGLAVRAGAWLSALPAAIVYNAARAASDHAEAGYRPRCTLEVHNAVDTERFAPDPQARRRIRAELGIPDDAIVAVIAARNHPQKDWPTALAAVREVPDLVAIAAGTGTDDLPDQPRLHRLGPRADMPAVYAAADLFVLPAAFGEGTSVAMSEAMAAGLPVVVTDVGDNARFGREAGRVVPAGNVPALRDALATLVADGQRRRALGARARAMAIARFSAGAALEPLFAFYDRLVVPGGSPGRADGRRRPG